MNMKRLYIIICIGLVVGLILVAPVLAEKDRIPAINTAAGQAVLVPQIAVEKSPVLEPADLVVEVEGTVFFCRYEEGLSFDSFIDGLPSEISDYIIETIEMETYHFVRVGGTVTADFVEEKIMVGMTNVDAYSGYQS